MTIAVFVALSLGRDAVLQRTDATLASLAASETLRDSASVIVQPLTGVDRLPDLFARVAERGAGTVLLDDDFRGSEQWRVLVAGGGPAGPRLIAVPMDDTQEALDLLGGILWGTAGLVVLVALAIGLGAGLVAQRRMRRIGDTLNRLADGDLQARTGINSSSDDLNHLARQLDTTALQLERLVAQTRHLSASLAHDLRTPLARLRARLEKLSDSDERSAALEEAERLSEIFDTIMRIARIEAGQGTDGFDTVDLGGLLEELDDIFRPVIEDRGKELVVIRDNAETVFADRAMVIQAVANLVQNALVHGGPVLTLFATGRELGVADNGDGVDPGQYGEIIKPMVRLDAARKSEGSGLGLALVRAVADRHGAHLGLSEHEPHGLRVAIKFTEL